MVKFLIRVFLFKPGVIRAADVALIRLDTKIFSLLIMVITIFTHRKDYICFVQNAITI